MTAESRPNAPTILHEIPYLRLFPWLRLFATPGAAAGPSRVILATVGLALTLGGWTAIDFVFSDAKPLARGFASENPPMEALELNSIVAQLTEPAWLVFAPFLQLFDREAKAQGLLHAALASLWTLVVWTFFGGAIARIAVLRLTRGERLGIGGALRFAVRKALPLVGGPLVPMLAFAVFAGGLALFGLLYRIPGDIGATVAGVLAFLPLLVGVLLTLIYGGLALGWPLMPPAVAAESEDGFDALSRSFAYLQQRPWQYGLYILLAGVIGGCGLVVVKLFATFTIALAAFALSFGGGESVGSYYSLRGAAASGLAGGIHATWLTLIPWLVRGWLYSYFWTAFSAIYLLLRLDVDGMPWTKVAIESALGKDESIIKPFEPDAAPSDGADS